MNSHKDEKNTLVDGSRGRVAEPSPAPGRRSACGSAESWAGLKKKLRRLAAAGAALAVLAGAGWLALGLFPDPLAEENAPWIRPVRVTDRRGRLLKEFPSPRAVRRDESPLAGFSPRLAAAVLAAEDQRFYRHPGFDPLAALRAAWMNLKAGRIRGGGSTITMQLARLSQGLTPGPRTWRRKLRELWLALLLERRHSKDRLLAEYLNRVPCGHLTEGFQAAAEVYLGKSARTLSWAESAFLAGLPAAPSALNPYKAPRSALARRSVILRRLASQGRLTAADLARAEAEPLALNRAARPFLAPHFVSLIRRGFSPAPPRTLRTTIDLNLQLEAENIVRETVKEFRAQGLSQAAVLALAVSGREVLIWVGSSDFFEADEGQNDGVLARRQPGSALKPFLYAAAFDDGLIHPASLLDDSPADYLAAAGSFSPTDYDGAFRGSVPARLALASSLNLPAVKLAETLGLKTFLRRLKELGLTSLDQTAEHYGLSLPLGGGEVTLLELTLGYAALADGGRWQPAAMTFAAVAVPPRPVFSPGAAFLVSDILSDRMARRTGFGAGGVLDTPYPAAVKTGTSQSFRDNWCLGYTSGFVVGVWAGNFQARPMNRISGVTGAGAIWRRVSDLLARKYPPRDFQRPSGVTAAEFCPISGQLAGPDCPNRTQELILARHPRPEVCRHPAAGAAGRVLGRPEAFGLLRPLNGEFYALDPGLDPAVQNLKALAVSDPEVDELVWLLNGREIKREEAAGRARTACLVPLARGTARLEVRGLRKGRIVRSSAAIFTVR